MPNIYSRRKGADPGPPGAVYVGRGTPWGNPFTIALETRLTPEKRRQVYESFKAYALVQIVKEPRWLDALRGKDLVCWCQYPARKKKLLCHAMILLALANRPEGQTPQEAIAALP